VPTPNSGDYDYVPRPELLIQRSSNSAKPWQPVSNIKTKENRKSPILMENNKWYNISHLTLNYVTGMLFIRDGWWKRVKGDLSALFISTKKVFLSLLFINDHLPSCSTWSVCSTIVPNTRRLCYSIYVSNNKY